MSLPDATLVQQLTTAPRRVAMLSSIARSHGTKTVVIVRHEGTSDEARTNVEAMIQSQSGFFDVATPIYEGDIVEIPDPRGGTDRRLAAEVHVNDSGPKQLHHTEVKWGKAPATRTSPVRRLSIEHFHPEVTKAASPLFADGHYSNAVYEAFKSIEVRVRELTGIDKSGAPLMGDAFGSKEPKLRLATSSGRSGIDEQEGFLSLFRGSMLAVRNPKAHEPVRDEDPVQALEYLGLASLLHHRLDLTSAQ
jgi:uncharacterized protein (TIGR02391 family)